MSTSALKIIRAMIASAAAAPSFVPRSVRNRLWNLAGNTVDPSARIRPYTRFRMGRVSLGPGAFVSDDCVLEDHQPITIGRNTWIGPRCVIVTSTHEIGDADQRAGEWRTEPVSIGDGCWLGASVTVLPGITIAPGCLIAAGSVVTADTEPNGLYGGVPAVLKRPLT